MPDRRRFLAAAVGMALSRPALSAEAQAERGEMRAPAVALRTSKGLPVLEPIPEARLTYLDFWASWCAPCRLSFPFMNSVQARWKAAGLRVVAINLDRREADAQRFLQAVPAGFEVAMDPQGQLAKLFDIQAMPSAILVGADRRILLRHRGFVPEDAAPIEARIRSVLGVA